jgi:hypothetical protein
LEAYVVAVLPPAVASTLLVGGAVVGIRRGVVAGGLSIGRNAAFGLAAALGLVSGGYTILILRALL